MSDDVPMACGDVFGINDMLDRLEALCREQGIEVPIMRLIEVDGILRPYFIPLHLVKNDQMNQFDVEVIFLLVDFPNRENREAEACRLKVVADEFERPCLLTTRAAFSPRQDCFYKNLGFMKMPVMWSDEAQRDYEVYVWGDMLMDTFANVMERVEYIGKEIVYKYYEQRREVQPEL
jgi:hypothetical protein